MPAPDGTAAGNDRLVRELMRAWERRDADFIAEYSDVASAKVAYEHS